MNTTFIIQSVTMYTFANVHHSVFINTLLQITYALFKINVNMNIIYTYMYGK